MTEEVKNGRKREGKNNGNSKVNKLRMDGQMEESERESREDMGMKRWKEENNVRWKEEDESNDVQGKKEGKHKKMKNRTGSVKKYEKQCVDKK